MYHTVYKITNQKNGKFYIGAHSTENLDDKYMGSGNGIKRAIGKYGSHNFKKEILACLNTREEMFEVESWFVDQEMIFRSDTYNAILGGSAPPIGSHNVPHTPEARKRISEGHKGQIPWISGKKHTAETIKRIKEARSMQSCPRTGKFHTQESKMKMSQAHRNISPETRERMRLAKLGKKRGPYKKRIK